jgi:hypothetical protein
MLSPDHILINRAIRIIPEYRPPTRSRTFVGISGIWLIVPIILVAIAYLAESFVPVKPSELSSVNLGIFIIAVALARLCGKIEGWIGAFSAILLTAWIAPPYGSLAVELAALPWFAFNAIMLAATAMPAPHDPINRPPLWRRNASQPPHKKLKRAQGWFVIADRVSVPLPR